MFSSSVLLCNAAISLPLFLSSSLPLFLSSSLPLWERVPEQSEGG
jgi:hypothetical protein